MTIVQKSKDYDHLRWHLLDVDFCTRDKRYRKSPPVPLLSSQPKQKRDSSLLENGLFVTLKLSICGHVVVSAAAAAVKTRYHPIDDVLTAVVLMTMRVMVVVMMMMILGIVWRADCGRWGRRRGRSRRCVCTAGASGADLVGYDWSGGGGDRLAWRVGIKL